MWKKVYWFSISFQRKCTKEWKNFSAPRIFFRKSNSWYSSFLEKKVGSTISSFLVASTHQTPFVALLNTNVPWQMSLGTEKNTPFASLPSLLKSEQFTFGKSFFCWNSSFLTNFSKTSQQCLIFPKVATEFLTRPWMLHWNFADVTFIPICKHWSDCAFVHSTCESPHLAILVTLMF